MANQFNYSELDDYDLKIEWLNLIEGMLTFTEENKVKYSEAWKNRNERKHELENELKNRKINVTCMPN
jgi:hypothetical protein